MYPISQINGKISHFHSRQIDFVLWPHSERDRTSILDFLCICAKCQDAPRNRCGVSGMSAAAAAYWYLSCPLKPLNQ